MFYRMIEWPYWRNKYSQTSAQPPTAMPKASLVKKKWGEKKVGHYVVAISYAISVFIIII